MQHPRPQYPMSPKQARAWFETHGICISAWCREQGLDRQVVVDLLYSRLRGHRGKAHHAAIRLGLKADPERMAA